MATSSRDSCSQADVHRVDDVVLAVPNVKLQLLADNAGTSPGMFSAVYLKPLNVKHEPLECPVLPFGRGELGR
jgi:hypothetical protein